MHPAGGPSLSSPGENEAALAAHTCPPPPPALALVPIPSEGFGGEAGEHWRGWAGGRRERGLGVLQHPSTPPFHPYHCKLPLLAGPGLCCSRVSCPPMAVALRSLQGPPGPRIVSVSKLRPQRHSFDLRKRFLKVCSVEHWGPSHQHRGGGKAEFFNGREADYLPPTWFPQIPARGTRTRSGDRGGMTV